MSIHILYYTRSSIKRVKPFISFGVESVKNAKNKVPPEELLFSHVSCRTNCDCSVKNKSNSGRCAGHFISGGARACLSPKGNGPAADGDLLAVNGAALEHWSTTQKINESVTRARFYIAAINIYKCHPQKKVKYFARKGRGQLTVAQSSAIHRGRWAELLRRGYCGMWHRYTRLNIECQTATRLYWRWGGGLDD